MWSSTGFRRIYFPSWCNTLQHTATHCNTLQLTAIHWTPSYALHHIATHCNSLQHCCFTTETGTLSSSGFRPLLTTTPKTTRFGSTGPVHEWVIPHVWMSHVTHSNESRHTYECVMAHTWMSHVTRMNESYHTYEGFLSHIWVSHVTKIKIIVSKKITM